jgi:hypothetical protein
MRNVTRVVVSTTLLVAAIAAASANQTGTTSWSGSGDPGNNGNATYCVDTAVSTPTGEPPQSQLILSYQIIQGPSVSVGTIPVRTKGLTECFVSVDPFQPNGVKLWWDWCDNVLLVWKDTNGDGYPNPGEPTVNLQQSGHTPTP